MGAGGPGQGDWEMQLVSWQTQSGGQGALGLGRQVELLQAGTGSLQGGTGDGVWTSGKMGNRVELSPFTAIWDGDPSFLSHAGYLPLGLHYCQRLLLRVESLPK